MDSFDSYVIRKLYQETAKHGDKLAKIEKLVNWKALTLIIQPRYNNQGRSGGRPNMDSVLMVKLLVPQAWISLSDPPKTNQLFHKAWISIKNEAQN